MLPWVLKPDLPNQRVQPNGACHELPTALSHLAGTYQEGMRRSCTVSMVHRVKL
jgi:hypothetical protein